jgi:hypothetical protein
MIPFSKTLVLAVFCCSSLVSSSQTYSNEPAGMYAFTAGITSCNMLRDSVHYNSGILFSAGISFSEALSDRFNLGFDVLYTGRSFKSEDPIIKYRFFYIDVPVYIQYKISESFRFNLGAQYSKFTNSQRIVIDGTAKGGTGSHRYDYQNIKDMDYGFLGGLEINLGENVGIGARYTVSGSTFFEKNKPNFGVFTLSMFYVAHRSYRQLFRRSEKIKEPG